MSKIENRTVKIVKLSDTAKIPQYSHPGDGACDLSADFPTDYITLGPYSTVAVPTGIKIELPPGTCALVLPRSGLSLTTPLRVANAPGLIDEKYRGEIKVIIDNIGPGVATIKKGDRLAQLMLINTVQANFQEVDTLSDSERGEKGFGSTGINDRPNS